MVYLKNGWELSQLTIEECVITHISYELIGTYEIVCIFITQKNPNQKVYNIIL